MGRGERRSGRPAGLENHLEVRLISAWQSLLNLDMDLMSIDIRLIVFQL
jgi:hypothetical protein